MRTTGFLPEVADRDPRGLWLEKGGIDSQGHAMRQAREILTREGQATFSPDVDARIRSEFAGMVAGELRPPEGWTKPAAPERRSREDRRRRREVA
jgi:trimethylamine--corrinoid protein Co-methyltransferase